MDGLLLSDSPGFQQKTTSIAMQQLLQEQETGRSLPAEYYVHA